MSFGISSIKNDHLRGLIIKKLITISDLPFQNNFISKLISLDLSLVDIKAGSN